MQVNSAFNGFALNGPVNGPVGNVTNSTVSAGQRPDSNSAPNAGLPVVQAHQPSSQAPAHQLSQMQGLTQGLQSYPGAPAAYGNPFGQLLSMVFANPQALFGGSYQNGPAVAQMPQLAPVPAGLQSLPGAPSVALSAPGAGADPATVSAGAPAHTVANATNSLASQPAAAGVNGLVGLSNFGAFSAAQPMFLMPVMLPMGMPVMMAVSVFGFALPVFSAGGGLPAQQPLPAAEVPVPAPPAGPPATPPDVPVAETPAPVTPKPAAIPAPVTPAKDPADKPVVDAPPATPVRNVSMPDFSSYQQQHAEESLETSLVLSLKTREGDEISLDFKQLDALVRTKLEGAKLDGNQVDQNDDSDSSERLVAMAVTGDISSAELAAIDAVLDDIVAVANQFFSGDHSDAMATLSALDFDSSTLAELSLSMSMTHGSQVQSGYREGADQLDQLRSRDGQIVAALDFLATEQRRLIDQAKEVLDEGSAARVVRTLLPPMLEDTLGALRQRVAQEASSDASAADAIAALEVVAERNVAA